MPRRGFCWRWSTFGQLFYKAKQHSTERQHKKNGSVQRYIERHPKAQKLKCAICNQQVGGSNPSTSSTSEWTPLHSKSPVERPGFSHIAVSFLLLPTKLCFANFRGGPGRVWRPARWTLVRAKAPVEGPGLSSSLRRSSLPHETLLCKLSRGPRQKASTEACRFFLIHSSLNRQSRFLEGKSE